MTEYVDNILSSWNLDCLIPVFKCAQIDNREKFLNLNVEEMEQIIPNVSNLRENFKCNYFKFLIESSSIHSESMPSTSFESPVLKENNLNSLNYNHKSKNNRKKRSAESIVDNEDSDVEELSESQVSLEDLENVKNFYSQVQQNSALYKYLSEDPWGKLILYAYGKKKILRKRMLCDIIMRKELMDSMNSETPFLITTDRLAKMTDSVLQLFTSESDELFFQHSKKTKDSTGKTKRINRSGIFLHSWNDHKDFLEEAGIVNKKIKLKKSKVAKVMEFVELNEESLKIEEPADIVTAVTVWKNTFFRRHQTCYLGKSGLAILEEYAILRGSLGPQLMKQDFDEITKNSKVSKQTVHAKTFLSDRLIVHWPEWSKVIVKYARLNLRQQAPKRIKDVVEELPFDIGCDYSDLETVLNENLIFLNDEHRNTLAFLILNHLIPRNFTKIKKFEIITWKPNCQQIISSFITHLKDDTTLTDFIKHRNEYHVIKNVGTLQPFIVIVGELNKLEKKYVVIGETKYECSTIIEAVDLAFKIFFSLKLEYSYAAAHIWSFIQLFVYNLEEYGGMVVSRKFVLSFISDSKKFVTLNQENFNAHS